MGDCSVYIFRDRSYDGRNFSNAIPCIGGVSRPIIGIDGVLNEETAVARPPADVCVWKS